MPKKIYIVDLTEEERTYLLDFIKSGTKSARKLNRARILLLADEGKTDAEIGEGLHTGPATVPAQRSRFRIRIPVRGCARVVPRIRSRYWSRLSPGRSSRSSRVERRARCRSQRRGCRYPLFHRETETVGLGAEFGMFVNVRILADDDHPHLGEGGDPHRSEDPFTRWIDLAASGFRTIGLSHQLFMSSLSEQFDLFFPEHRFMNF